MSVGKLDRYALVQQWLKTCKWYAVAGGILFGIGFVLLFYAANMYFEVLFHAATMLGRFLDSSSFLLVGAAFGMASIGMYFVGYWIGANEAVKKMKEIEKEELLIEMKKMLKRENLHR